MNKRKSVSDGHLMDWWRKCVRIIFGHTCAFCNEHYGLECHHIAKRGIWKLRWDWRNGILVCNAKHHSYAKSK
ncbi:hypothetical protein LCGC14_3085330, partial [marine sediment metagenome]